MPSGASDGMILDLLRDSTLLLPRVAAANIVARHASQDAGAAGEPALAPKEAPAEHMAAASADGSGASSGAYVVAESSAVASGRGEPAGQPHAGRGAGESGGREAGADAPRESEGRGGAEPALAAEEARRRQYAAMAADGSGGGRSAGAEGDRVASALSAAARAGPAEDPIQSLRARLAAARGCADPAAAANPSPGPGMGSGAERPASGQFVDWVDGAARGATLADVAASVDGAAANAGMYSRRARGHAAAPPPGGAPGQAHRGEAGAGGCTTFPAVCP